MKDHGEEYFGFMKMDAGRLTFAAAEMGTEIIPGPLASIRKATSERREYGNDKKAAGAKA